MSLTITKSKTLLIWHILLLDAKNKMAALLVPCTKLTGRAVWFFFTGDKKIPSPPYLKAADQLKGYWTDHLGHSCPLLSSYSLPLYATWGKISKELYGSFKTNLLWHKQLCKAEWQIKYEAKVISRLSQFASALPILVTCNYTTVRFINI